MMAAKDKPIVIIGTGLAGYSLAKEFRKQDTTTPLVLVTEDDGHFYSKPQLSTAFAQRKTPESLIITPVLIMQTQLQATIHTYTTVTSIDPHSQKIVIKSKDAEQEIAYQALVLACGAIPKPFTLLDNSQKHYRINSLQDYAAFIQKVGQPEQITIIGSGLVGCEFAHDFAQKSNQISVITPDPHPLYKLAPACIGEQLQQALEGMGISWHTQTHLTQVEKKDEILCLSLANGKEIHTQGILTAIGITPNIALAKRANLNINQGIVVDATLRTSDPHIYALGDCAEIEGLCRQYVAPILQGARALALTLCQKPTPVIFPAMPIVLKVSTYPVIVCPAMTSQGEWQFEYDNQGVKALFYDEASILQGYALSGTQIEHRQTCLKALGTQMVSA